MVRYVGIDLGTTNSCLAVYEHDRPTVVANIDGNNTTPSVVFFTDFERIVGETAVDKAVRNPKNFVSNAKRIIGRTYDDPVVFKAACHITCSIANQNDKPRFEVELNNRKEYFSPEDISCAVLSKLKADAEFRLKEPIQKACVTVPAHFNHAQRCATKQAAELAGFKDVVLINEPTAAALAYGIGQNVKKPTLILVFDFGGGTLDISIMKLDPKAEENFKVLSTSGNNFLGGEDIDALIVEELAKEFYTKFNVKLGNDDKSIRRLKAAAEKAKKDLSLLNTTAEIDLLSLCGRDFQTTLTRATFNRLCDALFKKTLEPVKDALSCAHLQAKNIDEIIMVGGSSHNKEIKRLLGEYFPGKKILCRINPDEAVALGAAIHAYNKFGASDGAIVGTFFYEVTPLSLGIRILGDRMSFHIPKNATIPIKKTINYVTVEDNQKNVRFEAFQGERPMTSDNYRLPGFLDIPMKPAKAGQNGCDVTIEIDDNGIIKITAKAKDTGLVYDYTVGDLTTEGLSKEEIRVALANSERFKNEDLAKREAADVLVKLQERVYSAKRLLKPESNSSDDIKRRVGECVETTETWMENNGNASAADIQKQLDQVQVALHGLRI